ncbi:unnamed protein product [Cuscuta epithymum]|uniref:Glycosyltransferase N-terminal domain-containing protein n=1 Tax=Cuscuta epithymum TaxID=186058 RepID=A0AAV0DSQ3_9ASTE|nr:unnamed protein product [Cuscuta epithymum]
MAAHIPRNDIARAAAVAVMVPLPGQGHLNQFLHLSRLLTSHDIPVYYTGAATHIRQAKLRVQGWDPSSVPKLQFHEFPTPSLESPSPDPKTRFPSQILPAFTAALLLREPLREFLSDLSKKTRRVVVIYDSMMAWNVQDVPSIPNAESYAFEAISALSIYFFHWERMQRPPLPPEAQVIEETPDFESCVTPQVLEFVKIQTDALKFNSGTVFNTCLVIEGAFLDLLAKDKSAGTGQIWAIGPFNPITLPSDEHPGSNRNRCLAWLDKQEKNSVIYIAFGSSTTFPADQIHQIAMGLVQSKQKFIWVVREADRVDVPAGDESSADLPEGFEEGIGGMGMVVRDWAPQLEILAHPSTGGFMSHCGWNSCMEGISMGVPFAAWPMHSEQPWNAALITKLLKTGVLVHDGSCQEVVDSVKIAEAVERLMRSSEGDVMRRRAEEIGGAIKQAVMEGGDICKEIESFVAHITRE